MKKFEPIIFLRFYLACDSAKVFEENIAFENIFGSWKINPNFNGNYRHA